MARTGRPFGPRARKTYSGVLHDIWQWEQELYDGTRTTYEGIARADRAYVVGVLPDHRILLVQDEQPDRQAVLTPAGGQIEAGESAPAAARREFLEETGYEIGTVVPWHTWRPTSRIHMIIHAFIGREVRRVREPHTDAGERVKIFLYSFEDFLALGHEVRLHDNVLRIHLLEALLDTAKRQELERLLYG